MAPLPVLLAAIAWAPPALAASAADHAPAAAPAQTILDRGPAFVAAVNDTSQASRATQVRALFARETLREVPEEKLLGLFQRLHDDYAPLEHHHTEVAGRSLHVFARRAGTKEWKDFQFHFEADPPHGLLGLRFIADVAEPVYLPNGALDSPETLAWLDGYIEKLVREEDLSGAVLLAKGDRVIFERHFGYADTARAVPVTPGTRFSLGSGNKMFTALAVMQLVGEGKLALDQSMAEFVPDFPDPDLARRITVRQLLSHSSGLGDYLTEEFRRDGRRAARIEEFVPFAYAELRANGPYFAPGAEHRYSNTGFLLLGRIIERVTGRDYYDFIRERIYAPLAMARSDHYLIDGRTPDLAQPLTRAAAGGSESPGAAAGGAPRRWIEAPHGLRGTSAGGGFSTCADMLRFARALVAGRIVPAETLATMVVAQPPVHAAEPQEYGLGFLLERSRGGVRSYGHGGTAPGVNFELRCFPGEDITLIAFSNQDNGAYDDLRRNIVKLITGDR
jgi:CubicO group peptidase (beta-lactamase class C family)